MCYTYITRYDTRTLPICNTQIEACEALLRHLHMCNTHVTSYDTRTSHICNTQIEACEALLRHLYMCYTHVVSSHGITSFRYVKRAPKMSKEPNKYQKSPKGSGVNMSRASRSLCWVTVPHLFGTSKKSYDMYTCCRVICICVAESKEPYACQKSPTHVKRVLRYVYTVHVLPSAKTPVPILHTCCVESGCQKSPTHVKRALRMSKEPYACQKKSPSHVKGALCISKKKM